MNSKTLTGLAWNLKNIDEIIQMATETNNEGNDPKSKTVLNIKQTI